MAIDIWECQGLFLPALDRGVSWAAAAINQRRHFSSPRDNLTPPNQRYSRLKGGILESGITSSAGGWATVQTFIPFITHSNEVYNVASSHSFLEVFINTTVIMSVSETMWDDDDQSQHAFGTSHLPQLSMEQEELMLKRKATLLEEFLRNGMTHILLIQSVHI